MPNKMAPEQRRILAQHLFHLRLAHSARLGGDVLTPGAFARLLRVPIGDYAECEAGDLPPTSRLEQALQDVVGVDLASLLAPLPPAALPVNWMR